MSIIFLEEKFETSSLDDRLQWYCEPERWKVDDRRLVMETDKETDFWQKTHYGFQADNGHFLFAEVEGNFRMTTKVTSRPRSRYDQAGLMIRTSENTWVKTSLEYIPDGKSKLGAVVTNRGYSDWSTQYVDIDEVELYYRISKVAQNVYVDVSHDGENWQQIRISHLDVSDDTPFMAGVYACSPQGEKQEVSFEFLQIERISDNPSAVYL
ncbi:DUF1349 domain-containing protein [Halobacillus fulvus]|nr:DUF1349 domain-containing protein [Halobacillus fulvus]